MTMKRLFLFLFVLLSITAFSQQEYSCRIRHQNARNWTGYDAQADNSRSDTIDILHYFIQLEITDFTNNTIKGFTTIRFTPLMNNVNILPLDLLQLNIDSIKTANSICSYSYDDTLLHVTLPATYNIGDTVETTVWYDGSPQGDPSGWGGFYFQNGYAYNLGVGFDADPHNYGRVWFPCFDNFVERSTYTFNIGTNNGKVAYCNGTLLSDTTAQNGVRWRTWHISNTIPTYLASVAVAGYTHVSQTFNSMNGQIPVMLTALPADTTAMKNSFINLQNCLNGFEARYYPYEWERIGFCLVPFSSGAMEHATNISYPRLAANGSLTYETLMAHEFSHHWFGDLATCRTQEDMWLNEGWATYSEYIFLEWMYGRQQYDDGILANHDDVIHFTHLKEGGYRAVSGVPHAYTYGDHVYLKGADVAHSLRGYMGDSLFFLGLNYHLHQSRFKDVSSDDLKNNLIAATGLNYLNDFFNDWVYNPGFPHFSLDSVVSVPAGPSYNVTVYVEQKLRGAPQYYTNVPIDIAFLDQNRNRVVQRVFVSGHYSTFNFTLPFDPAMTILDMDNKLSDAITAESKLISTTGAHNLSLARVNFTVSNVTDTTYIRVEHNWAKPDSIQNNPNNFRISSLRYWKIDGIFSNGFNAKARFYYDGRTTTNFFGQNYWLDYDLTVPNGDSIVLLYRRDASDEWHEWPHYTKTRIGAAATSKYGYVDADSIQPGEYAFANGISSVVTVPEVIEAEDASLHVYPNPAENTLTIDITDESVSNGFYTISDIAGRVIYSGTMNASRTVLDLSNWNAGLYFITYSNTGKKSVTKSFVVQH
ncbi:MAG: hypothetical protein Fur0041_10030 [Bacteroidia bacterium]